MITTNQALSTSAFCGPVLISINHCRCRNIDNSNLTQLKQDNFGYAHISSGTYQSIFFNIKGYFTAGYYSDCGVTSVKARLTCGAVMQFCRHHSIIDDHIITSCQTFKEIYL
jgi:hypothetical protein